MSVALNPIVMNGRVTLVGDDDSGQSAVWVCADGQIRKVHVSREERTRLSGFLFDVERQLVIRPASEGGLS